MFIGNLNSIGRYTFGGASFTNDYSVLLDGVDEYVNCGRVQVTESQNQISISYWIKANTLAGNEFQMGKFVGANDKFYASKDGVTFGGAPVFHVGNATSNGSGVATNTLSTSAWSHVVVVFDGTATGNANRLKMYLNGSLETLTFSGTIPNSTTASITDWALGALGGSTSNNFDGYLDEVAMFDYILDATQASSLYNSGTPTDLDNTSGVTAPVHWWRMGDGDTFPTITDVGTTGGNNGTMTNMEAGDIVTDTP